MAAFDLAAGFRLTCRLARVQNLLPAVLRAMRGHDEGDRLVLCIKKQKKGVVRYTVAALVNFINGVSGKPYAYGVEFAVVPVLFAHLFAVRAKPREVFDFRAAKLSSLKKLSTPEDRVLVKKSYHPSRELKKLLFPFIQIPVEPRNSIVLTVSVIVSALRAANLIARLKHGHAL